ncbi:MAG: MCE family protein [Candidatus Cloacimonetes bacterium]|nr:MCE family protein [Candidatus Cloacimonadota bacterium]
MTEFHKNKKSTEARVGLILLLAFFILIAGYAWLTNSIKKSRMKPLTISFADAARLEPGDSVYLRGIAKGLVEEVKLSEKGVSVKCLVELKSELPLDTKFLIKEKSMMGGHLLEIIPGNSGKPLDITNTLSGEVEPGLFAVVNQASTLLTDFEQLLWRLNKDEGMIQNLEETAQNANKLMIETNSIVRDNKETLILSINNFSSSINKINFLLSQNVENIDQTLATIPRVIKDAEETLNDLKASISEFQQITAMVNSGTGTAGKLLADDELYISLRNTVSEADSLLKDIKQNPKRYLKISVF